MDDAAAAGSIHPVVSVVVPCFNDLPYVLVAVESARSQTLEQIEVIVVDDGSDAQTQAALEEYRDDPRIRLIRQENAGPSGARNTGIAASTGKYVGFLDADDLWHPAKAATHASYMDEHDSVDVTFSHWMIIDSEGRDTGRYSRYDHTEVHYEDLLLENVTGTASTLVVRRSAIDRAGMLNDQLRSNVDLEWLLRIAENGPGNIHCIKELLTGYRRHGQQITSDWRRMQEGWEAVLGIAEKRQPEQVASTRVRARASQEVYWSYLAYESRDYDASRRLLISAWKSAPRQLIGQPRVWRITGAALASRLPRPVHRLLHRLAELISGRRLS